MRTCHWYRGATAIQFCALSLDFYQDQSNDLNLIKMLTVPKTSQTGIVHCFVICGSTFIIYNYNKRLKYCCKA